jgi:Fe-S cluster assembly iron-binding protein IscA
MTGGEAPEGDPQAGRRGFVTSPPPIHVLITPRAQEALIDILRVRPRGSVVHLTVVLGANPHPSLAIRPPAGDQLVFEQDGIPLVVDPGSRKYLAEATVDQVVEDGFASFAIDGPNLPKPPSDPE